VIWDKKGRVVELPVPEATTFSVPTALSNAGVCVGYGAGADPGVHAFRWLNKTSLPQLLEPLVGDQDSRAQAVNKAGLAVGETVNADASGRAVTWAPGSTSATALPDFPGSLRAAALGVNDRGDIVGTTSLTGGGSIALYWPQGGTPVDLNTFAPADSGIQFSHAVAINNKRMIAAWGTQNGASRMFLIKL
jgi:uncharacterized membrane protein